METRLISNFNLEVHELYMWYYHAMQIKFKKKHIFFEHKVGFLFLLPLSRYTL